MRPLLQFFGFLFIVFFIVGELQGWYVGIPAETPMFLYKADHIASSSRTAKFENSIPLSFKGNVKRGEVLVEVMFNIPASFQGQKNATSPVGIYHKTFYEGDEINIDELLRKDKGCYTVRISYADSPGIFKLKMSNSNDL